ncbi:peptidase M16 family protein [Actinocorallia populi]|uniref:insulinase family protein n=1 Tax=Actinocorallia populi TaxID=2079200 RepID=UPI000D086BF9|nr:insulinase family protein [Actinocorallia populi]
MEITRTDVGGVPAYWTDGPEYRAALMFRVGRADETLARSGITHLVEHLALYELGGVERHFNGMVDARTTMFVKQGSPEEVARYLKGVCAGLARPPMERLEAEKQVLRTEEAGQGGRALGDLLLWRYGSRGRGLLGYHELGLPEISPELIASWTRYWFTRGNAVLAFSGGPPPEGLVLDLPDGPRRPTAPSAPVLPRFPAHFPMPLDGLMLHAEVERGPGASLYRQVLQRRLHDVLRRERALSYTTSVEYRPDEANTAEIVAFADGLQSVFDELATAFLEVVDGLASHPVGEAELAEAKERSRENFEHRDAATALVTSVAWDELMGAAVRTPREQLDRMLRVTPQDVRRTGVQVRDSALLALPPGVEPADRRYQAAPGHSPYAMEGHVLHPWSGSEYLIAAPAGLTKVSGTAITTIRYADCTAVLAWPDGARQLFGPDGVTVRVEPGLFRDAAPLVHAVDRSVRPDAFVRMPPREHAPRPEDGGPPLSLTAPPPEQERRGLFKRRRSDESDPPLAEALTAVRAGRPEAGLAVLAASRGQHDLRDRRLSFLSDACSPADLGPLRAARPDDPDLLLWAGSARIQEAWRIRSDARAEYVAREQFTRFWLVLSQAGEPLLRAAHLLPDDPAPWDTLQFYGLGMQLPRPDLDRYWAEVVRRDPYLYPAHYNRAQVLAAKWQGSDAESLEFADETLHRAPPGHALNAIVASVCLETAVASDDEARVHLARPDIYGRLVAASAKFLAAPQNHPKAQEAHQYFGAAFYHVRDLDRARHHLSMAHPRKDLSLAWLYARESEKEYRQARNLLGLG